MNTEHLLGFTAADLADAVDRGLVRESSVGDGRTLYNYTPETQFNGVWTPVTLACRGLILDATAGSIIARPFGKFFNLSEMGRNGIPAPPSGPVWVSDKFDGSLGIVHWYAGRWRVATRGSLDSEQAVRAEQMLDARGTGDLVPGVTYLVEIIYPENRILVDYGADERLVLLDALHVTGQRADTSGWMWRATGRLYASLADFVANSETAETASEREGWVIRWVCGTRAKLKTDAYVKAHRLRDKIHPRAIWKMLRDGDDVDSIFAALPDEFHEECRAIAADLRDEHQRGLNQHRAALACALAGVDSGDRKLVAQAIKQASTGELNSGVMFGLLDGRSVDRRVWDMVSPVAERPNPRQGTTR